MRLTCLLLVVLLGVYLPAHAGHSPPKVVLRVHVQTTGEGLSAQEATTITLPPNGEQIQVRTLPDVSEQQLIAIEQDPSGNVHLHFNHVGQVSLSAVTAENQGRILVVLVNGYVVYAPIIDQQITNGELDLPHALNPQIIQNLKEVAQHNVRQAAKT